MSDSSTPQDDSSGQVRCTWALHVPDDDNRPFASCFIVPVEEGDARLSAFDDGSALPDEVGASVIGRWEGILPAEVHLSEEAKQAVHARFRRLWLEIQTAVERTGVEMSRQSFLDTVQLWITPIITPETPERGPPSTFRVTTRVQDVEMVDSIDEERLPQLLVNIEPDGSVRNIDLIPTLPVITTPFEETTFYWRVHKPTNEPMYMTCSLAPDSDAGDLFDPDDSSQASPDPDIQQSVFDCWMGKFSSWKFKGRSGEDAVEEWWEALDTGQKLCHRNQATVALTPRAGDKMAMKGNKAFVCMGAVIEYTLPTRGEPLERQRFSPVIVEEQEELH